MKIKIRGYKMDQLLLKNAFIYGIYSNEELMYIGKTHRPIEERLEEHRKHCHNKKLKKIIETGNFEYKIIYEAHDLITEETLSSIEESYISLLKPSCNECGVTRPYVYSSPNADSHIETEVEKLNKRKYYTERDLEILFDFNPIIKQAILIEPNDNSYKKIFNIPQSQKFNDYQRKKLFGKLNNFNEMVNFTIEEFDKNDLCGFTRQKTYAIKLKDGTLRFPTQEEKLLNCSPDGPLIYCHILFMFDTLNNLKQELIQINNLLKNDSLSIHQFEELIIKASLYQKVIQKYIKKEIYWTSLSFAECEGNTIVVPINDLFGIDDAEVPSNATFDENKT